MSPKWQRGPDGGSAHPKRTSHSHPRETKRRGGDETRPVRARYSIDCFLPPAAAAAAAAAARAPPSLSPSSNPRCPSHPAAPRDDHRRRARGRIVPHAPLLPLPEGDPQDRRPVGRGMGGRDD
ncbi:hypothetical protein VPH35_081549 [Triticum aestivum]